MSYNQGQVHLQVSNKIHYEWIQEDGTWGKSSTYWLHNRRDLVGEARDGRRVPHREEEWTFEVILPHSCDAWEIGGAHEIKLMIKDLERALVLVTERREE